MVISSNAVVIQFVDNKATSRRRYVLFSIIIKLFILETWVHYSNTYIEMFRPVANYKMCCSSVCLLTWSFSNSLQCALSSATLVQSD